MEIVVKPIAEYPAYYTSGNQVFGVPEGVTSGEEFVKVMAQFAVDGKDVEQSPIDFCVIDGVPHWTIKFVEAVEGGDPVEHVKKAKLVGGKAVETDYAVPDDVRLEGTIAGVVFSVEEYEGDEISVATRDGSREPMGFIVSALKIDGGMLLGVLAGRGPSRPAGLLNWIDGTNRMTPWKSGGRLWTR